MQSCDLDQQSIVHVVLRPGPRGQDLNTASENSPRSAAGTGREPGSLTRVDFSGSVLPTNSEGLAAILNDAGENGALPARKPGTCDARPWPVKCLCVRVSMGKGVTMYMLSSRGVLRVGHWKEMSLERVSLDIELEGMPLRSTTSLVSAGLSY